MKFRYPGVLSKSYLCTLTDLELLLLSTVDINVNCNCRFQKMFSGLLLGVHGLGCFCIMLLSVPFIG